MDFTTSVLWVFFGDNKSFSLRGETTTAFVVAVIELSGVNKVKKDSLIFNSQFLQL